MFDLIPRKKNSFIDVWRSKNIPSIFKESEDLIKGMIRDFDNMIGSTCYKVDDGIFNVEIEVPGFNKDNLTVEVGDGVATISGKREFDQEKNAGHSEIYKQFSVGEPEEVDANLKDGILTLTLKYPAPESAKKVEVKG